MGMLDDSRIVWESTFKGWPWLGRLADTDVLDVGATEDDVLVGLIPGGHRAVGGPVLGSIRPNFGQGHGGLLGVDGVEDALVPDLRLGDQGDLGPEVGDARSHPCAGCRGYSRICNTLTGTVGDISVLYFLSSIRERA